MIRNGENLNDLEVTIPTGFRQEVLKALWSAKEQAKSEQPFEKRIQFPRPLKGMNLSGTVICNPEVMQILLVIKAENAQGLQYSQSYIVYGPESNWEHSPDNILSTQINSLVRITLSGHPGAPVPMKGPGNDQLMGARQPQPPQVQAGA